MANLKAIFCAVCGVLGACCSAAFGGFSEDLTTLIILMATDFITGLLVAGVFKNSSKTEGGALSSGVGFRGLCRKCVMLLCVLTAHRLDVAIGCDYIKTVTVIGFIANEGLSIIENAASMGVPIPSVIKKAIEGLDKNEDR